MMYLNTLKMSFNQMFNTIRTWFSDLIDRMRESRQPAEPTVQELAVIADILKLASQHNMQAETVGRALGYMQLYPQLGIGDAMILGSSTWSEQVSDQDEP